jgi:tetratricopeptide (TPR) repeat protein
MNSKNNKLNGNFLFFIITFLFSNFQQTNAQSKGDTIISITSRDTIEFKFKIRDLVIPEYEKLLNFIADKTTYPNEIERIVKNKINESREGHSSRLFFNDKIIIENDLFPGADTLQTPRDLLIEDYLKNFNSQYQKSEPDAPAISFRIINISPLQKSTYFYYKVFTECKYYNNIVGGISLTQVIRVFEINILKEENEWKFYIQTVRFPTSADLDSSKNYYEIQKVQSDIDLIYKELANEKERKELNERKQIFKLKQEAEDDFASGNYELARDKYRNALSIDIFDKSLRTGLEKSRKAIEEAKKKSAEHEERKLRILNLTSEMKEQINNFNFKHAKLLCDSLVIDYQIREEEIIKLHRELGEVNTSIAAFELAREKKNLKNAENLFVIEERKMIYLNKFYKAELFYQLALTYFVLEFQNDRKMLKNLDECILNSDYKHQNALRLRAIIYSQRGEVIKAISDATRMIQNNPRVADNYIFRAELFKKDKSEFKAIEDYSQSILYGTSDSTVFLNKALLEYDLSKYNDAVKSSTLGLAITKCYGDLFFIRAKANNKIGNYQQAGDDFKKAAFCGIPKSDMLYCRQLAESYVNNGRAFINSSKYLDAKNEFSHAIDVDSSHDALYWRGRVFSLLKNYEEALYDFTLLIKKNKNYRDVFCQRAIILMKLERFYEALNDFDEELKRFPDNYLAAYEKGNCRLMQGKFPEAIKSFEFASSIIPTDSAFFKTAYAYFNNNNFILAVATGNKAIDKSNIRYEGFYITGRALLSLGKFKEAVSKLEKAKEIAPYSDDVLFYLALALEKSKNIEKAVLNYNLLSNSKEYRDTSLFRSAICLIKIGDEKSLDGSLKRLLNFESSSKDSYKYATNCWIAYIYLRTKKNNQAEECLRKAREISDTQSLLNFILACKYAQLNAIDESLNYLEKAILTKELSKDEIVNEKLLEPLKGKKYKLLINKYFE